MHTALHLFALLSALFSRDSVLGVWMDGEAVEALKKRLTEISDSLDEVRKKADEEKRELTPEEMKSCESLLEEFEKVKAQLEMRERMNGVNAHVQASGGRHVPSGQPGASPGSASGSGNGGSPAMPNMVVVPQQRQQLIPYTNGVMAARRVSTMYLGSQSDADRHGFDHVGDFAAVVARCSAPNAQLDNRLSLYMSPTTSVESPIGEHGGFAMPPAFVNQVTADIDEQESLMALTDQNPVAGNHQDVMVDESTPWESVGGVKAYWMAELDQLTQSRVRLTEKTLKLNKLGVLVPASNESLADSTFLLGHIQSKAPGAIRWKVDDAILNGTGVGTMVGILNSNATVVQAKESGQAADTIVHGNIVNMHARMHASCLPRTVWLMQQDAQPQLNSMTISGSSSGVFPVYLPPGGLSSAPYGTLMGRPVIPHEACRALGDKGDIYFVDLTQYLLLRKASGIVASMSMHLYFDYDAMAFKFIFRVAGMPWWSKARPAAYGANSRSCFITLAERA